LIGIHKPTYSGRYLNFYFSPPSLPEEKPIIGLVDRIYVIAFFFLSKKFGINYHNFIGE